MNPANTTGVTTTTEAPLKPESAEAEKIARLRALRLAKEEMERKGAEIRKARRALR